MTNNLRGLACIGVLKSWVAEKGLNNTLLCSESTVALPEGCVGPIGTLKLGQLSHIGRMGGKININERLQATIG